MAGRASTPTRIADRPARACAGLLSSLGSPRWLEVTVQPRPTFHDVQSLALPPKTRPPSRLIFISAFRSLFVPPAALLDEPQCGSGEGDLGNCKGPGPWRGWSIIPQGKRLPARPTPFPGPAVRVRHSGGDSCWAS